jgi:hypothetical protein
MKTKRILELSTNHLHPLELEKYGDGYGYGSGSNVSNLMFEVSQGNINFAKRNKFCCLVSILQEIKDRDIADYVIFDRKFLEISPQFPTFR